MMLNIKENHHGKTASIFEDSINGISKKGLEERLPARKRLAPIWEASTRSNLNELYSPNLNRSIRLAAFLNIPTRARVMDEKRHHKHSLRSALKQLRKTGNNAWCATSIEVLEEYLKNCDHIDVELAKLIGA